MIIREARAMQKAVNEEQIYDIPTRLKKAMQMITRSEEFATLAFSRLFRGKCGQKHTITAH